MLEHGGHLIDAVKKYNIPLAQWLDLSTGINPNGWPIPEIPVECWVRLPETSDGLVAAARKYYQCHSILPVAGTQAAIQTLPLLRKKSKVGVLNPAYAEHAYNWQKAGHEVIEVNFNKIEQEIDQLDVLVLINPNNPTGQNFSKSSLLKWHNQLDQRGGWLIIDEAFIDSTPKQSLASYSTTEGLIILRSVGKFFGLAGIRCGFVIAEDSLLSRLNELLGPWSISHPSRYIASLALIDKHWQKQNQLELKNQSIRLINLLSEFGLPSSGSTDLFVWVKTENAYSIFQYFAKHGILTRFFNQPLSLRFGLPKNVQQWQYLEKILKQINL